MMGMVMAAVMEEETMVESQWSLEILRLQANHNKIFQLGYDELEDGIFGQKTCGPSFTNSIPVADVEMTSASVVKSCCMNVFFWKIVLQ